MWLHDGSHGVGKVVAPGGVGAGVLDGGDALQLGGVGRVDRGGLAARVALEGGRGGGGGVKMGAYLEKTNFMNSAELNL